MLRRLIKIIALVLATIVVGFALSVIILRITNPGPAPSTGWKQHLDMPDARGEVAAARAGDDIVVAGGLSGVGSASGVVSVYDTVEDRWSSGRSLPQPRHHAAAASVDGFVYVSGGADSATDWTPAREMWRARPGQPWRAMPPMPEGRQGHAMVAHGDRLYVVGGAGDSDDVLVYDTSSRRWTRSEPLPNGRDHIRAVVTGDEIWALGGRTGSPLRDVHVFDIERERWRGGPRLPVPMSAMAVGVLRDGIHVIGGEDPAFFGGEVSKVHVVYADGKWRGRPEPILAVHGAGFATADNRLFVIGGASRPGALSVISWTGVTQAYGVLPEQQLAR